MSDLIQQSSSVPQQTLCILGSTGSIGQSTLDVLRCHPDTFSLFALSANRNWGLLAKQCLEFKPTYAVLKDEPSALQLQQALAAQGSATEVLSGEQALADIAKADEVTTVMAAIVGAAGLLPTLAAVNAGKKVLLANKEALVMAGALFIEAVHKSGAQLLPIDSEHNAIFQCLPPAYATGTKPLGIRKLILTGSGGPFRQWSTKDIDKATPEQACKHPNWSMGRKISVDSASLMNKGLEFIEARWLFGVCPKDIEVLIHPQSVIHSMVEYVDGSVLAQLGHPDMCTPIAHALAWPQRMVSGVASLDLMVNNNLSFEAPDVERFPALALAIETASKGMGAATVLNAANEVAVAAFLEHSIGFSDISVLLAEVMSAADYLEPNTISDVLNLDQYARHLAHHYQQSKLSA